MKKVVEIIPEQQFVELNDVQNTKFYGVLFANKNKGMIVGIGDYLTNRLNIFAVLKSTALTSPKIFRTYESDTLCECIKNATSATHEVFEFDSYKELFQWLIL